MRILQVYTCFGVTMIRSVNPTWIYSEPIIGDGHLLFHQTISQLGTPFHKITERETRLPSSSEKVQTYHYCLCFFFLQVIFIFDWFRLGLILLVTRS